MAGIVRMIRALVPLMAVLAIIATPAEARRFRFGGFGGSGTAESIDRVADLPDRDPYLHDGASWDLGWFHRARKVLGVTTSDSGGQYVLYNGERYVKLDATTLDAMKEDLGYDPTAAHRTANAAAIAAAEAKTAADDASLKDNIIPRRDGESIEAYHARARTDAASRSTTPTAGTGTGTESGTGTETGTGTKRGAAVGSGLLALILGIALLVGVTRYLSRRQRDAVLVRGAQGHADPAMPSFDERVAARLRALDANRGADERPAASPVATPATAGVTPVPAPVATASPLPGVRTFGRRTA